MQNINKIQIHFHNKAKLKNALLTTLNTINLITKTQTITINNKKTTLYKNNKTKNIKFLFKPSQTLTVNYKNLKKITKNLKSGILLLSNSQGIMTNKKALLLKTGGHLLCYINTEKC